MVTYTGDSPVFAKPLITPSAFQAALRQSPAAFEADVIRIVLVDAGFDPAVFLGQFAAESSLGAAGYARMTRSPGNIVISYPALPHWTRAFGGVPWRAPNGRTYAKFPTWRDGTRAYIALMQGYRLRGWAKSITTMAGRWLGMADASQSGYVRNIVRYANSVIPVAPPAPARVHVRGTWWDYTKDGGLFTRRSRTTDGFSAMAGPIEPVSFGGKMRSLVQISSGIYIHHYVDTNGGNVDYTPAT